MRFSAQVVDASKLLYGIGPIGKGQRLYECL